MPKNAKSDYIGKTFINSQGLKAKVINYYGALKVEVEFEDGFRKMVTTQRLRNGMFLNNAQKRKLNQTEVNPWWVGNGDYKVRENNKITPEYRAWYGIINRCYNVKSVYYHDCKIDEIWLNFQNFGKWYITNLYNFNNERMEVDKDILIPGNKLYSSTTCLIVPSSINIVFRRNMKCTGDDIREKAREFWNRLSEKDRHLEMPQKVYNTLMGYKI